MLKSFYFSLLFASLVVYCSASSGTCGSGNDCSWVFDNSTDVLTISGTGDMTSHPWSDVSNNIKSVVINSGIKSIADEAFKSCSYLETVSIPNTVLTIGTKAFSFCVSLNSLTIPNSVTKIGERAFEYCKSLKSVFIPSSVTKLQNYAFDGCKGLESAAYENGATTTGKCTFESCINLTSITLPNTITEIGNGFCQYCHSLQNITIPNSVTKIGGSSFNECPLTSLTIPDSVESISSSAFYNAKLETVTIGRGLKTFSTNAFYGSIHLESYNISDSNPYFKSVDGVVYNKSMTGLVLVPQGKKSVTIPDTVTAIASRAFADCRYLDSIKLPSSVTYIGYEAFYSCGRLWSFAYEGTEDPEHGDGVFKNCRILQYVRVPVEYESETFCEKPVSRGSTSTGTMLEVSKVTSVIVAIAILLASIVY